jgi:hypothetical protein
LSNQSEKQNRGDRTGILKTSECNYKLGSRFPSALNDTTTLEHNSNVRGNISGRTEERECVPIKLGAILYVKNDNFNVLTRSDEKDNGY